MAEPATSYPALRTESLNVKLSVLLVEDDTNTRTMLESAVNGHARLKVAAAVGTVEAACNELDQGQPDVLLVDLGLPDGDGTDLIREICRRGFSTDVMVITVFGDERHVVRAIEAGATGYILKDELTGNISASIMQLVDGGSPISAPIARHLLTRFLDPARIAGLPGPLIDTSCGSGHMLALYHDRYDPERPLVGIDLSPGMVSITAAKLASSAEVWAGDMRVLDSIEAGTAAAVLSFFAIHHLGPRHFRDDQML